MASSSSGIPRRPLWFVLLGLSGSGSLPGASFPLSHYTLGYTELQTRLPGGRHANFSTARACLIRGDGDERRELAPDLDAQVDTWTQFAGWSPNGRQAVILSCRNPNANAAWEERHRRFRHSGGWLVDILLLDPSTGRRENLSAVDRVSDYNSGLFFWPGNSQRLGFTALLHGVSHPFSMDRDGRNKKDLTSGASAFTYGFEASPDGRRISYHKDYQIYLADRDGANALRIETGHPFNFSPRWSPDGQWVLFLSGEATHSHPHLVRSDGSGLRKLADRGEHPGRIDLLDVDDFHGGSSDLPVWSPDGRAVFYTARLADRTELMRVTLEGTASQLTNSPPGTITYQPVPSPDGTWIAFGSTREPGRKQLFILPAAGGETTALTRVENGWAAWNPLWRPRP